HPGEGTRAVGGQLGQHQGDLGRYLYWPFAAADLSILCSALQQRILQRTINHIRSRKELQCQPNSTRQSSAVSWRKTSAKGTLPSGKRSSTPTSSTTPTRLVCSRAFRGTKRSWHCSARASLTSIGRSTIYSPTATKSRFARRCAAPSEVSFLV